MATQKQVFTEITESIDRCNHTLPGLIQFLKNGFQKLENASGGGGGGSEVAWTQIQASGTKIAEIEIDGDKTSVYAPTGASGSVSVTADGVKTNSQLLDELFALIDISKLNGKSAFSIIGSNSTECFNIISFNATRCVITQTGIQSNTPIYALIIAKASASTYGEYLESYNNLSSTVPRSGTIFKIEY